MGVPASTLYDYYKRSVFAKYSRYVKPLLTPANQAARLKWALDFVHKDNGELRLDDVMDYVHARSHHTSPASRKFHPEDRDLATKSEPAKRTSRNRPAGHPVMKPVTVTRVVYRCILVNNVIPAIRAKWPSAPTTVKILQNNAKPHVLVTDPVVEAACRQDGWSMSLVCQPPNSPDLNVLDVEFFRAMQSLQAEHR
ncbi:hypothetical protein H257_08120 [Aphanomyces astaci]|uniref:Tc1-like transposase DDE domain-containing protein n=1 Tax=Aphanomyces astaci TaxID=112090 RepID=W4GI75_APHAT|nr:hypothetical protein H257_08120 [Aphanomyces astaci]ETV78628.1 hypothetical protein H257_08120 [Aphanomyces astaci]|eukprot:XP_009832209.1 hypothetical protein H257_08120 [Aphanomyces astaci]